MENQPPTNIHVHDAAASADSSTEPQRTYPRPSGTFIARLYQTMSPFERLLAWIFGIALAGSSFVLAAQISMQNTVVVPARGGTITEGIVGAPRFINPLLAISDADRDVTALVYSGLMRHGEKGSLIPDLASSYSINEDGTEYTFTIRPDATFHDGTSITSEDILFTVAFAQNPDVKSPKRADWDGVVVEAIDAHTVKFTMPRPYGPFLENATLGILPHHLWGTVSPEEFPFHLLNTEPIGSGPFKVREALKRPSGALERIELTRFEKFALGEPYLDRITIVFYPNEDQLIASLNAGDVNGISGISPERVPEIFLAHSSIVQTTPLSRTFAVFFNQSKSDVLTDLAVRRALDISLDKTLIIEHVLHGYGVALDGPIPQHHEVTAEMTVPQELSSTTSASSATTTADSTSASSTSPETPVPTRIEAARALLEKAGWEMSSDGIRRKKDVPLTIRLATGNAPALSATAEEVAATWRELGANVSVEAYNTGELNTNVIRPREYEALLFGEIVGRSLDLFAFWHSTQRSDPGLNLALYANPRADRLLAEARTTADLSARAERYTEFSALIQEDVPAVFLYAPEYIYVTPVDLNNVRLDTLTTLADRFANAYEWYTEVEYVWPIFTK